MHRIRDLKNCHAPNSHAAPPEQAKDPLRSLDLVGAGLTDARAGGGFAGAHSGGGAAGPGRPLGMRMHLRLVHAPTACACTYGNIVHAPNS